MKRKMNSEDRVVILEYSKEEIFMVELLWKKLNAYLSNCSVHFSKEMKQKTFEQRVTEICTEGTIRVFIAYKGTNKVGYCISKYNGNIGEISSLYVDEGVRKLGIGSELMTNALRWLNSNEVNCINVNVAIGNEGVLEFYKKFNFFDRHIVLRNK